jgi:hypothetical protein
MLPAPVQAFFQGAGNPAMAGYLAIQVRRGHVVEDALSQIMVRQADLKKPLRVTFVSGGVPEPAQVRLGGGWAGGLPYVGHVW